MSTNWITNSSDTNYLLKMLDVCGCCGLSECAEDFRCDASYGRTRKAIMRYDAAVARATERKRTEYAEMCARPVCARRVRSPAHTANKKNSAPRCSVCGRTRSRGACSCCSTDCCRNVDCQLHYPTHVDKAWFEVTGLCFVELASPGELP